MTGSQIVSLAYDRVLSLKSFLIILHHLPTARHDDINTWKRLSFSNPPVTFGSPKGPVMLTFDVDRMKSC